MTKFTVNLDPSFAPNVTGSPFAVDWSKLPQAALDKIFTYGAQRLFNDAAASAKGDARVGHALAQKRLDALYEGIVRASGTRGGDPIRRRALEIAESRIRVAPKFISWCQAQGFKISDKRAVSAMRAKAQELISGEGNPILAQAKLDVEASKELGVDIEFDV